MHRKTLSRGTGSWGLLLSSGVSPLLPASCLNTHMMAGFSAAVLDHEPPRDADAERMDRVTEYGSLMSVLGFELLHFSYKTGK